MIKKLWQCYHVREEKNMISKIKKILFPVFFFLPLLSIAQSDSIMAGVYSWKETVSSSQKNILSSVMFEGSTHDMAYLQMSSNAILTSKRKTEITVSVNEEQLLIVRSGNLSVGLRDSTFTLCAGSITLIMPGDKYFLQNATRDSCTFYLMRYRSKLPVDINRKISSGSSFVIDWNKVTFKPHDKGGIRNFFEKSTPMGKRLEMHFTTLNQGLRSHDPHTHHAAEMIVVTHGDTEMQIGQSFHKASQGDIIYLTSNVPHAISNKGIGACTYFAFQFE
jgi:(S)-ureidoglycine aminohydrolase